MNDLIRVTCDYVGCENGASLVLDPYAKEIDNEDVVASLCGYHYAERWDDI
jgi:hypothetical protein